MPTALAICLETVDAPESARYVRCVALSGTDPGLSIARNGQAMWQAGEPGLRLCVTGDGRLGLLMSERWDVAVRREGRVTRVQQGKPVILIDGDELEVSGVRLRVHVHGAAQQVHAPEPLSRGSKLGLAAVVALGATAIACCRSPSKKPEEIEVRDMPPIAAPMPDAEPIAIPGIEAGPEPGKADGGAADAGRARDAGRKK